MYKNGSQKLRNNLKNKPELDFGNGSSSSDYSSATEARFRAIAEQISDAFYLHDENGIIIDVNHQACDSLGYSHYELIGMKPEDFDADVAEHSKDKILSQLRAGNDVRFDTLHRRKDGSTFPVEVRMRPFQEGGRWLNVAIVRDISERKNTESMLLRLNRELAAISTSTQVLARASSELELLNQMCETICVVGGFRMAWVGYPENNESKSVRPVAIFGFDEGYLDKVDITWADTERGRGPTGTAIRTGVTQVNQDFTNNSQMELWRDAALARGFHSSIALPLRIDTSVIGCLTIYSEDRDAFYDDEVKMLEVLAKDVSYGIDSLRAKGEHQQAEMALRKSEERYRTIFLNSPLGIFQSKVEGQFIDMNPVLAKMYGFDSPTQAIREITDIGEQIYVNAEERRQIVSRQLTEGGEGRTLQHLAHYRRRDGEEWFANIYIRTVCDEEGRPIFFEGIVEDVSDRVKAEQERDKLQKQLIQAQKMESVGRLAGGIAHDFNNILGAIIGFTELSMDEDNASKRRENLEQVINAAHRSVDLIQQLLTFARKQIVAPEVLDINETVLGLLNLLQRMIGEDVSLLWQPGEGIWQVNVDPSQVDQILANLCVNARDAIEGSSEIVIETRNVVLDDVYCIDHPWAIPGEYVNLVVSDNGQGMDKETLSHVFEPFFSTKERGKGTGLGLSTVYGIVKQNQGYIDIDSKRGRGTTVSIYFPKHEGEIVKKDEIAPYDNVEGGRETILIVEDESMILEMAKLVLEKCGYHVLSTSETKEAIHLAKTYEEDIHLLITDVIMPQMNGRELAEIVLGLRPGIRCLFMSGYSENTISCHGVLDDEVNFIQKPFSTSSLATVVRQVLDSKS